MLYTIKRCSTRPIRMNKQSGISKSGIEEKLTFEFPLFLFSITVRYLCHLLPNQSFTEKLQAGVGRAKWSSALVHAWLRCGLHSPQPSHQMQELTRLVYKLEDVSAIINSQVGNWNDF